jgi:ATP-binding protein involved in chromosome partitioning
LDAVKSIAMFNTVKIPVLGMIENMSGFVCPDCNKQYDIFGTGGAQLRAQEYEIPFLGAVPINIQIRSQGDGGSIGSLFEDAIVAPHLEKLIHSLVTNLVTKAADEPLQPSLPILG